MSRRATPLRVDLRSAPQNGGSGAEGAATGHPMLYGVSSVAETGSDYLGPHNAATGTALGATVMRMPAWVY